MKPISPNRTTSTGIRILCSILLCLTVLMTPSISRSQSVGVTGRIEFTQSASARAADLSDAVVWLTPLGDTNAKEDSRSHRRLQLLQKNKSFSPHVLVVQVGEPVDFPNRDPFFHNVFSLFEGKRFDLGLYEAGTTRFVHFDRAGVSYVFCNIHPEMSAVVIALKTPYYASSDASGKIAIPNVPEGRYLMDVWAEGVSVENLKALSREVVVSGSELSLGTMRVTEDGPPKP